MRVNHLVITAGDMVAEYGTSISLSNHRYLKIFAGADRTSGIELQGEAIDSLQAILNIIDRVDD